MWRDKPVSESESNRVARYWDDLVTGNLGIGRPNADRDIDPTLAQTIAWLERFDDAQPAAAEFSRTFETQFLNSLGAVSAPNAVSRGTLVPLPRDSGGSQRNGIGSPRTVSRQSLRLDQHGGARQWVLASLVAAALIVVSLMTIYHVVERHAGPEPTRVILAPSSALDVPMDRGNAARSGVMPGPEVTGDLTVRWRFVAGRDGISTPVVVGDSLFVTNWSDPIGATADQGAIIAIDATTGAERWQFPTEHPTGAAPAVAGGIVYAGDAGGVVYALDAETGEEHWRRDLQTGWTSEPVVVGDLVIIATTSYQSPIHVAVQENTVVVGSGLVGQPADGFTLYALDRRSGEERWHAGDDRAGQPELVAFDMESGAARWQFAMPSLESGPAITGRSVYAGSTLDGTIYALDLISGEVLWRTPIDTDLPLNSSPAVSGGRVYVVAASGMVICLDGASGQVLWQASTEHASVNGSPVVVGTTVYVVDTEFGVTALSAVDGSVLWSEQLELTGQVAASPIVVNGALYIGTSLEDSTAIAATLWALVGSNGR